MSRTLLDSYSRDGRWLGVVYEGMSHDTRMKYQILHQF
jgi:hypothetical protein